MIGFSVGYRLGVSRAGTITMALIVVLSMAIQIAHVLTTQDRELITILPIIAGSITVLSILFGTWLRLLISKQIKAT